MEDEKDTPIPTPEEDSLPESMMDEEDDEMSESPDLPEDEPVASQETGSKVLSRGDKTLRRSLLKKIRPVVYHDSFKSKSLTVNTFIEPVLNQKVDRFAALIERLMPPRKNH
ncbi:MAG: hypothetical protein IPM81_02010 [Saprospirales bacterium]|jgi:hypothetical protein|nr:hypothetical protein [Saprospirales bacterium]